MRLYSYIVRYDSGFSPCVAEGLCTLACCKPTIRRKVRVGDWVLGTSPSTRGARRVVYLMRVDFVLTFKEYWRDGLFSGRSDNIYKPTSSGHYEQVANPWHGCGAMRRDLGGRRVLGSRNFVYFGDRARLLPRQFWAYAARGRGHRVFQNQGSAVSGLKKWAFRSGQGRKGRPYDRPSRHFACEP
jgi:Nucleotide modification associated domain 2